MDFGQRQSEGGNYFLQVLLTLKDSQNESRSLAVHPPMQQLAFPLARFGPINSSMDFSKYVFLAMV